MSSANNHIVEVRDTGFDYRLPDNGEIIQVSVSEFVMLINYKRAGIFLDALKPVDAEVYVRALFSAAGELRRRYTSTRQRLVLEGWTRQFAGKYQLELTERISAEKRRQLDLDDIFGPGGHPLAPSRAAHEAAVREKRRQAAAAAGSA